jgi:cytochrome c553
MHAAVRTLGLAVAGVGALLILGTALTYVVSERRLTQRLDVPAATLLIPTDVAALQRGQHLASAVAGCTDCHGPNLAGRVVFDDPALGRIVAPNLTRGRGGLGNTHNDADYVTAIRHGLDPRGRRLLLTPDSQAMLSDDDVAAIVAYVRSLPAIDSSLPPTTITPLGRALFVAGQLPLIPAATVDQSTPRPAPPRAGPTAEYGAYLTLAAGCARCHGPDLGGGRVPLAPLRSPRAPDITPAGLRGWTEADFLASMRTGVRPDGSRLNSLMPWGSYAQLTDDELRAIWRFLMTFPGRA